MHGCAFQSTPVGVHGCIGVCGTFAGTGLEDPREGAADQGNLSNGLAVITELDSLDGEDSHNNSGSKDDQENQAPHGHVNTADIIMESDAQAGCHRLEPQTFAGVVG